jgi:hypothetical protein
VSGLRLVAHFLCPSADALTRGMTRAAVSEGMRKVARGGLVPLSCVTSVSSALARSVASGSKVLRLAGLVLKWPGVQVPRSVPVLSCIGRFSC